MRDNSIRNTSQLRLNAITMKEVTMGEKTLGEGLERVTDKGGSRDRYGRACGALLDACGTFPSVRKFLNLTLSFVL